MTVVAFGPLAYDVRGVDVPAAWRAFLASTSTPRVVEASRDRFDEHDPIVRVAGARVAGLGFRLERFPDRDLVRVDSRADAVPGAGIVAAVAALATLDAPGAGALVLHCAGVRARGASADGVVLLLAPPGTGKSTRVSRAGERAWTYNGALVLPDREPRAYPLPFAGDEERAAESSASERVLALAMLERSTQVFLERCEGGRATMGVLRAVVRPEGEDPLAAERARLSLELLARVPVVRLGSPPDASYLAAIDQHLESQRESTK